MEQLSFTEKLGILFENILAHPFFICILLLPVLIIFLNKKITKKAIVLIYIAILAIVLFIGNSTLFALFDNLIDGIFMALYFPNFVTLFLVEVISAVICLITFLRRNFTKVVKVINITGFVIIQMLFALILTVVQSNNIDIYQENALYASNDVLTLMQLLMGTFALQIITLLVVKAIDKVTDRLDGNHKTKDDLPEGRIKHATLPPVKVIVKEPEVKLDKAPKIKPLDKSLIEEAKIKPLDVNEEIIKDKNKPKAIEPSISDEQLEFMPKVKPLDKSLIKEDKISPLDVNEEIIKDKKQKELLREPLNKDLIENYDIKPIEIKEEVKPVNPVQEVFEKQEEKPFDFKMEFPDEASTKVTEEVKLPELVEIPKAEPVKTPEPVIEKTKPLESALVSPSKLKPIKTKETIESKKQDKTVFDEEKELIANLVIVDYDKTVLALKNLSTVYTL